MNKIAVLLLSGGLDSIVAGKIIKDEGIDLTAMHFTTLFNASGDDEARKSRITKMSHSIGVPVEFVDISEDIMQLIKKPRFGYGSSVNPCIDCHLFMFKKAFRLGEKRGASFIVTGEVLGERPMSQRKGALELIDKESGMEGLILRPLSAKLLPETLPEKEKIVNRENLYSITGRGRTEQIKLAKKFGIKEYPNPAGGCLLTDKIFGIKIKDLLNHDLFDIKNMVLLKYGRHFRLSENTKLIVARDKKESNDLIKLASNGDLVFETVDIAGPTAILVGKNQEQFIDVAGNFVSRYSDNPEKIEIKIEYFRKGLPEKSYLISNPTDEGFIAKTRIG